MVDRDVRPYIRFVEYISFYSRKPAFNIYRSTYTLEMLQAACREFINNSRHSVVSTYYVGGGPIRSYIYTPVNEWIQDGDAPDGSRHCRSALPRRGSAHFGVWTIDAPPQMRLLPVCGSFPSFGQDRGQTDSGHMSHAHCGAELSQRGEANAPPP